MRCMGKTKSGVRCKRNARAESEFCATHADQAGKAAPDDSPAEEFRAKSDHRTGKESQEGRNGSKTEPESDFLGGTGKRDENSRRDAEEWLDVLTDVAMVGTVVVVALVFSKVLRVF